MGPTQHFFPRELGGHFENINKQDILGSLLH